MSQFDLEALTPSALVARAIAEATNGHQDDETYWALIHVIQKQDAQECWSLVAPLAKDPRPEVRSLFPDIFRYFDPHPLRNETIALLTELLKSETSPLVLSSIASAFGDLADERAIELLSPLLEHADADVREAALHGLLPIVGPKTLTYFMRAATDDNPEVRNWATFGLRMTLGEPGDTQAFDTEELRDALVARLLDPCTEARAEAILALATRGDRRALEPLKQELSNGPEWDHCVEAAEWFALPELYPLLKKLLTEHPEEASSIRAALAACKPRASSDLQ